MTLLSNTCMYIPLGAEYTNPFKFVYMDEQKEADQRSRRRSYERISWFDLLIYILFLRFRCSFATICYNFSDLSYLGHRQSLLYDS